MKYFFELGSNPTLSIAEIAAVFGQEENYQLLSNKILIADGLPEFDENKLIKKMGGVIKIGIIEEEKVKCVNMENFLPILEKLVEIKQEKLCFGISYYGKKKINNKHLGMEIKNFIKERSGNCRWVSGRENILSSVIVEQNKLINKGFELVIIENENGYCLGKTMAVQPFKELSKRDYGRPARDDQSGMLPPKLAQIMINLACTNLTDKLEKKLLDPFCGSGTIITEAMLMGYKNLIGSDLSAQAVLDTKKNIDWIQKQSDSISTEDVKKIKISQIDVKKLSSSINPKSIDAIVSEPYLGPQRGLINYVSVQKELENLYSQAISQFGLIVKQKRRVVIIFPVFTQKHKKLFLNVNTFGFKIINPLPRSLQKNIFTKISFRDTVIYGREGQKVWREIVILEKE